MTTKLTPLMREFLVAIRYHWPADIPVPPQWTREARALKRAGLCRLWRPPPAWARRPLCAELTEAGEAVVATLDPRTGEPLKTGQ